MVEVRDNSDDEDQTMEVVQMQSQGDSGMAEESKTEQPEEVKGAEEVKGGTEKVIQGPMPHHNPARRGISDSDVQRQYERGIREAASITVCNYSSLNMAINMGFAGRKHIASDDNQARFSAKYGQVNQLKELIGGELLSATPADISIRAELINILVELMMSEEIESSDLVDCLDDWMEENFNVLADEISHQQIGAALVNVREELTYCAVNDLDLPSGSLTLQKLHTFNQNN